ncbi:hypothetical protein [uncultured Caulobacter sp.]|nr:hypothetical protein [uncultured Caulobacter sp.]
MDLKSLVQKIVDNRWNLTGLASGFILGVAGVLFRPQSPVHADLVAVSV